ncbi:hypothetical protein WIW49_12655 [Xanthomonas euroxanthea]|jgi:hypothetical protein
MSDVVNQAALLPASTLFQGKDDTDQRLSNRLAVLRTFAWSDPAWPCNLQLDLDAWKPGGCTHTRWFVRSDRKVCIVPGCRRGPRLHVAAWA